MKTKGITLIESVVTIAVLGIIFLLATPLIRSFGRVDNRAKTQKKIDAEFSVIHEFMQKKVKSAKFTGLESDGKINSTGDYASVYTSFDKGSFDFSSTTTDGSVLFLEIPDENSDPVFTFFIFDKDKNELIYREGISGNKEESIMGNLNDVSFHFKEGVVLYYIDYGADLSTKEKGKFRTSFKGSASSRIDFK